MNFFDTAFENFAKNKPVSVMVRATLENTLSAKRLDDVFDRHAQQQYTGELLFSTVAELMGEVVLRIQPTINFAWRERKDEIGVTVKSVYDKLSGIEAVVSRAMVRETAKRKAAIIRQLGCLPKPVVSGYRTKIIDGNHLRHTDSRIGPLREVNVAPLPGKSLVILDPRLRLAIDVIPCLDGHAQERSLLGEALEIETAFQEMAENLEGEIETLGYPKAALFGFCMALVSYNLMSVVRAAVASQHGDEAAETFSTYYACHEVSQTTEGMSVVLPPKYWQERYGRLTPTQMAAELSQLAAQISLSKYRKNKWITKARPPDKPKTNRRHASTMRILVEPTKLKAAGKN